ncbi:uncharacterized protein BO97DRAFT_412311 [Aspergillus homomorphus CBS 101889]|uniref:Uncharacterized protein n=1 Tax=Aspergillus homomorphus (strain CBS 101889) TaxID=1450537 RepID=A0A395I416_ASPHC|nr:hypothetical protein BO97DRAFT_412311 [Aspergillus homomorphus CBS 101889]RAL14476.1 hypothetical protein BO97DRAFT_412311 [Aspergillus homomorphus CBS 101889]
MSTTDIVRSILKKDTTATTTTTTTNSTTNKPHKKVSFGLMAKAFVSTEEDISSITIGLERVRFDQPSSYASLPVGAKRRRSIRRREKPEQESKRPRLDITTASTSHSTNTSSINSASTYCNSSSSTSTSTSNFDFDFCLKKSIPFPNSDVRVARVDTVKGVEFHPISSALPVSIEGIEYRTLPSLAETRFMENMERHPRSSPDALKDPEYYPRSPLFLFDDWAQDEEYFFGPRPSFGTPSRRVPSPCPLEEHLDRWAKEKDLCLSQSEQL